MVEYLHLHEPVSFSDVPYNMVALALVSACQAIRMKEEDVGKSNMDWQEHLLLSVPVRYHLV